MNVLGRFSKAPGEITPYTIMYASDMDAGDTLTATAAAATETQAPPIYPVAGAPQPDCYPRWGQCYPPPTPPSPPPPANPLTVVYAIYTNDPTLGAYVKVMLSGGASGARYSVVVTSTTNDGRTMEDSFVVAVK